MPVFDFSNMQAKKEPVRCTYAMVYSDNDHASPENPILQSTQHLNLKKKMAQSAQIS